MQFEFHDFGHPYVTLPLSSRVPTGNAQAQAAADCLAQEVREIERHCPALLRQFQKKGGRLMLAADGKTFEAITGLAQEVTGYCGTRLVGGQMRQVMVFNGTNYLPDARHNFTGA